MKTLKLAIEGRQSHTLTLGVREEQTHMYLRRGAALEERGGKQKVSN